MAFLELQSVSKHFGGVHALQDVSFKLEKGKTLGLVGGNGSGKTTLLNAITKMVVPDKGQVFSLECLLLAAARAEALATGEAQRRAYNEHRKAWSAALAAFLRG